jgi:hypothetical protein
MGIDYTGCEAIFRSFKYVKNKTKALTLGRQGIHIHPQTFNFFLEKNNLHHFKNKYVWGYCEQFFMDMGYQQIESLDYSSYEGATITHNMNQPILYGHEQYDYILDAGTTEHIFNVPQVCENIINLLKVGGIYVSIIPNNNLSGHGIYQFSPEFFLSAYSRQYGMEIQELYLAKVGSGYESWINVNDFTENGRNMSSFDSTDHVYIIAIIKKISNDRMNLITQSPNQYSYEKIDWQK